MPVTTAGAAVAITPVVIKVFAKHYARRISKKVQHSDKTAQDDILFDEAFHVVKAFIDFACRNTVESLQAFTNTHIPSPYWFKVVPTTIPPPLCDRAADIITALLGTEGVNEVLGGSKWWTIRGTDAVEAEWIAMQADVKGVPYDQVKKSVRGESQDPPAGPYPQGMDQLKRVMLYLHGGGFYWGSINTHRYQLGRFARKMKSGRVFTVNYRKAPHYPFPCALQDCVAAYLYLINPPAGAPHKAVLPDHIIIAGDSAGGNLALTLLTVIRDYGLPPPAGGVLISPWIDLTHSFPSVMDNTATDILTPHGFIHEPSPIWPLPPRNSKDHIVLLDSPDASHAPRRDLTVAGRSRGDENNHINLDSGQIRPNSDHHMIRVNMSREGVHSVGLAPEDGKETYAAEIRSQIQLYATNEQLRHPLVSPLLHGSLGGLPPLYILAGDGECLRDEIIMLAHRAAEPKNYRLKTGMRYNDPEKVEEYDEKPTHVRLQVYDGMCHVLTVFTFIDPAHYAYRAIGEFARQVIPDALQADHVDFYDDEVEYTDGEADDQPIDAEDDAGDNPPLPYPVGTDAETSANRLAQIIDRNLNGGADGNLTWASTPTLVSPVLTPAQGLGPDTTPASTSRGSDLPPKVNSVKGPNAQPETFIRERISIRGVPRSMEAPSEIAALRLPFGEIGIVKEGPVVRWLTGLQIYDKKYARQAKKAMKTRQHNERQAQILLEKARNEGVIQGDARTACCISNDGLRRPNDVLDLVEEHPPPSAICARSDTSESIVLLRNALLSRKRHANALKARNGKPIRHVTAVVAAQQDLNDAFKKTQDQGVARVPAAEEQVRPKTFKASHGARLWASVMNHYHRKRKETLKRAVR